MNKRPFEVGQIVLYKGAYGFEVGKIKRIKNNRQAYVWYHSGDTAALTDFEFLKPIVNDYCIQDLINKKAIEEREEQEWKQ